MIIILDTNILHNNFFMKSGQFTIFIDYIKKTQSRVVLPKIVYDELSATFERELKRRIKEYGRTKGSLEALLQNMLPEVTIPVESETTSYLKYVKETLNVSDNDIFDYKETYLHDVIDRAIQRRRPCTERGEEIRDAVLWHSVLDIADESPEKSVIFISNNTKQFALDDTDLHPHLIEDYTKRNLKVIYFTSLESFAKQHASNIEFITNEWLRGSINFKDVLEGARGLIESYAEYRLPDRLSREKSPTGYFRMIDGSLDVENFYVYEMADGSLKVELALSGNTEIECEVEKIIRKEEYDYDYERDFYSGEYERIPVTRLRSDVEYEYKYLYPTVYISLDITVKEKKIVEWKVIDGNFEADG